MDEEIQTSIGLGKDEDGRYYVYEKTVIDTGTGSLEDLVLRKYYLPTELKEIIEEFSGDPERHDALEVAIRTVLHIETMREEIVEWMFTAILLQVIPNKTAEGVVFQFVGTWRMVATMLGLELDDLEDEENSSDTSDIYPPTRRVIDPGELEATLNSLLGEPKRRPRKARARKEPKSP